MLDIPIYKISVLAKWDGFHFNKLYGKGEGNVHYNKKKDPFGNSICFVSNNIAVHDVYRWFSKVVHENNFDPEDVAEVTTCRQ